MVFCLVRDAYSRTLLHEWYQASPAGIFPNSITRVVPAPGWPSDWLTLSNQTRNTQCGCRGLGSVMCSYCQSHTEDVVAWLTSGEALCYVHLLSVAAYGGHGRVMRSDKTAFSVTLGTIFWIYAWKDIVIMNNEHDEADTCLIDLFQVE